MAFAVKLLNGEREIKEYKPLFENKKFLDIREMLISLLLSDLYEIEL